MSRDVSLYRVTLKENVDLDWSGNVFIKKGQEISREEYDRFFNPSMITYEKLREAMSDRTFDIFLEIPAWTLNEQTARTVTSSLLKDEPVPEGKGPQCQLEFASKDDDGDRYDFYELPAKARRKVLGWMMTPKNGACRGSVTIKADMDRIVEVEPPVYSKEADDFTGFMTVCMEPDPCRIRYTYKEDVGTYLTSTFVSPYGDGSDFEIPFPEEIDDVYCDLCDIVEEECEKYLREREACGYGLDEREEGSCLDFAIADAIKDTPCDRGGRSRDEMCI